MSYTNRVSRKDTGSIRPLPARRARALGTLSRRGLLSLAIGSLFVGAVLADPISVPNGDFSDPGNNGSIGGLIGPNIVNQMIGTSGPWHGTALGIAGLLAQPTLTISNISQTATIGGLLGINLAGLLNNGGYFQQQLSTTYQFGRLYILSANVNAGVPLNLDLLGTNNVGIGLAANGNVVASSTTTDPTLLHLDLLDGNDYRIRFGYVADIAASGFIQLRLFNQPSGLLTANLLESISFSSVQLEGRDIGPPAVITVDSGDDPNDSEVGTPFDGDFMIIIEDEDGDGVPAFAVRISAPTEGASAMLSSPSSNDPPGPIIVASTDLDGIVYFNAQANDVAGCYRILVEPMDPKMEMEPGVFYMRNWSNDPSQDSVYCNGFQ